MSETEPHIDIPEPLQPAEEFIEWWACLRADALGLARRFSKQFRVTPEEGIASLLLTVSHSLGESLQVALPHGNISPPFNLLAITPEQDPIWTGSLLRYLRSGIEEQVERRLRIQQAQSERDDSTDTSADEAIDPQKRLERLSEAAGLQVLRQMVDTITRDSPRPPFPRPPIDSAVSLLPPTGGLLRSLSKLSPLELLNMEEALSGVRSSSEGMTGPVARPSFFWQLHEADAPAFFRQHGERLMQTPFLIIRGTHPSFPSLDIESPALRQFDRLAELLFKERHARHGNPQVYQLNAELGKPVMRFLEEAGKWQATTQDCSPMRWVADLGIKLSLSLMRLEDEKELSTRLIENGLELAKFFARRKIEHLSATGWRQGTESAETTDLTNEERRAYLKICESEGMTKAELRRSSHDMTADERDRIVAKLLSYRLIRQDGKLLRQNAV